MTPDPAPTAPATDAVTLAHWLSTVGAKNAFSTLVALVPDVAVFVVDADQNIVLWSKGAEALTGYSAAELEGGHCLKGSRCVECLASCGIREHGAVDGVPLDIFAKDGSTRAVKKYARAFVDDQGVFRGGIEVLVPRDPAQVSSERGRSLPILATSDDDVLDFHGILTKSAPMRQVLMTLKNVARTDVTVLVRGESGTGKELVARAIHQESHRKSGPFLAINCAAMSANLLESELFGHEKGAFTGAVQTHHGLFERTDGGTLFLDEVAELPLDLQAKLLRVLEDRTFYRVGGTRPITVDVRVVSATHRSLRREVSTGRFREDLMYRLRVVPLFLPTLRERKEDLPLLVQHFVRMMNARGARVVEEVEPDAMRVILAYDWPGNVRELRNAIEYAFAVAMGRTLTVADLPRDLLEAKGALPGAPPPVVHVRPTKPMNEDEERALIAGALKDAGGHIGLAANALGMSRPTLWRKRKKLGI